MKGYILITLGVSYLDDKTIQFKMSFKNDSTKEILLDIYRSLEIKGYDPVGQIIGYLLSEDPTYITSFNGARQKIVKLDRYEILTEIMKYYLFN